MTIIKITLENYIMFGVNNITHLEYTPNKGMNTILGGNGAGKSKLLYELTPLPINKKHYINGYKLIIIEHNNSTYELYSGNDRQSFKVDDEELNKNGLITTQNRLAIEHFSIDADIRDLNLANIKFTELTISERKKWFTRISTTDYKFSINLYNKLKVLSRDLKGSVKMLNSNNVTIDLDMLTSMEEELKGLKSTMRVFTSMLSNGIVLGDDPDFDYLELVDKVITDLIGGLEHDHSPEQITSIIDVKNEHINVLNDKLKTLSIVDEDTISSTKKDILGLTIVINGLKDNTHTVIENDVFKHMFDIRTDLLTLFENIKFTPNECATVSTTRSNLLMEHKVLKERLTLLEDNRHALEDVGESVDVACPECNHSWSVGFSKKELSMLLIKITATVESIDKYDRDIHLINIEYSDTLLSISADAELRLLISNIFDESVREILYTSIGVDGYEMELNQLYVSIENSSKIFRLTKELEVLDRKLITQNLLDIEDVKRIKEEVAELETALGELYTDVSELRDIYKDVVLANKQRTTLTMYKKRIKDDISVYEDNTETLLTYILNKLVLDTMSILESKMSILSNNIARVSNDKAVVNFTNKKIGAEKRRIEVIDELMIALSPDGGIIAESLSSFMHVFIDDMNKIIETIWQYELKVLPCNVDDGDLDYIFKVKIPNNTLKDDVDDVKNLSTGQTEIINFAFKLTTFNYLKVLETPIMLDEVFVNLEIKHKDLAFKYIEDLIDSYTIEQAFMISHRDESHTTIDDSTIILDGISDSKRLKIKIG